MEKVVKVDWCARANAAGMFWRCSKRLRDLRDTKDAEGEARAEARQMLQLFAFSGQIPFVEELLKMRCEAELAADEDFYGEGPNSAWLWDFDEPESFSEPLAEQRKSQPWSSTSGNVLASSLR